MVSFPVELLMGRLTPEAAAQGFGMLALWLAVGCGIVQLAWRRASARYSAVGA